MPNIIQLSLSIRQKMRFIIKQLRQINPDILILANEKVEMMSIPQNLCHISMRHKETVLSHSLVKVLRCGEVQYDWSVSGQK